MNMWNLEKNWFSNFLKFFLWQIKVGLDLSLKVLIVYSKKIEIVWIIESLHIFDVTNMIFWLIYSSVIVSCIIKEGKKREPEVKKKQTLFCFRRLDLYVASPHCT